MAKGENITYSWYTKATKEQQETIDRLYDTLPQQTSHTGERGVLMADLQQAIKDDLAARKTRSHSQIATYIEQAKAHNQPDAIKKLEKAQNDFDKWLAKETKDFDKLLPNIDVNHSKLINREELHSQDPNKATRVELKKFSEKEIAAAATYAPTAPNDSKGLIDTNTAKLIQKTYSTLPEVTSKSGEKGVLLSDLKNAVIVQYVANEKAAPRDSKKPAWWHTRDIDNKVAEINGYFDTIGSAKYKQQVDISRDGIISAKELDLVLPKTGTLTAAPKAPEATTPKIIQKTNAEIIAKEHAAGQQHIQEIITAEHVAAVKATAVKSAPEAKVTAAEKPAVAPAPKVPEAGKAVGKPASITTSITPKTATATVTNALSSIAATLHTNTPAATVTNATKTAANAIAAPVATPVVHAAEVTKNAVTNSAAKLDNATGNIGSTAVAGVKNLFGLPAKTAAEITHKDTNAAAQVANTASEFSKPHFNVFNPVANFVPPFRNPIQAPEAPTKAALPTNAPAAKIENLPANDSLYFGQILKANNQPNISLMMKNSGITNAEAKPVEYKSPYISSMLTAEKIEVMTPKNLAATDWAQVKPEVINKIDMTQMHQDQLDKLPKNVYDIVESNAVVKARAETAEFNRQLEEQLKVFSKTNDAPPAQRFKVESVGTDQSVASTNGLPRTIVSSKNTGIQ